VFLRRNEQTDGEKERGHSQREMNSVEILKNKELITPQEVW
jgi:hypothetical protein